MKLARGCRWHVSVALALSLLVVAAALALAACGHSGSGSVAPSTQAALPTWAPDASPSPAYTVTEKTGTTAGLYAVPLVGIGFTPLVDVEVSALGFFDGSTDGLRHSHRVGVFERESKHSVVSVIVRSDSTLEGAFRWESVDPVVLQAGKTYIAVYETSNPQDEVVSGRGDWAPEFEVHRSYEARSWQCPEKGCYLQTVASNFKFKPVSAVSPSP
jgi:hypothetical protein